MSKSAKKRTVAATSATAATKAAQQSQNERKPKQGESRSKQSHVIAMLRSPAGATDRRDDEGHGLAAALGAGLSGRSDAQAS